MSKRFEIPGKGQGNVPYRVDIYDAQWSGGVTTLDGDGESQYILVDRGDRGQNGMHPIYPSELRVFVRDRTSLQPLFKRTDREVRMEVVRTDTGHHKMRGYMLTDFFEDAPWLPGPPAVEIRGADGLTTLKQYSFGDFYGSDSYAAFTKAIVRLLTNLYPSPNNLDVEFGVEWYPDYQGFEASNNPLHSMGVNPENFLQKRDREDSEYLNAFEALKELLSVYNLTLRQVQPEGEELHWHIRHRSALDETSDPAGLKVFRYDPDGVTKEGYPKIRNVERDLTGEHFDVQHRRGPDRRWQSVTVTHDHMPIGNLVDGGDFEGYSLSDDGWTEINQEDWAFSTLLGYSTNDWLPDETQQNKQLLGLVRNEDVNLPGNQRAVFNHFLVKKDAFTQIQGYPRAAAGELSLSWGKKEKEGTIGRVELSIDHEGTRYYLADQHVEITIDAAKGEGHIYTESIPAPLKDRTVLPIVKGTDDWEQNQINTFTVDGDHPAGAQKISGTLEKEVSSGRDLVMLGFQTDPNGGNIRLFNYGPLKKWQSRKFRFSLEATDGTFVTGPARLRIGGDFYDLGRDNRAFALDDIELSILLGGSPLDETKVIGFVGDFGEDVDVDVRTSDSPSKNNLGRLLGNLYGAEYLPENFGIGPGGGSLTLKELIAQESLRYMRKDPERLILTFPVQGKAPMIEAHELIKFDGRYWTISNLEHSVQEGSIKVEILEYTDHGTSGIQFARTIEQSDSTGGGSSGGGGVTATPTPGGSIGSWGELTGKPKNLLARGGDNDGSTDALSSTREQL
jgi:hypothetical protein